MKRRPIRLADLIAALDAKVIRLENSSGLIIEYHGDKPEYLSAPMVYPCAYCGRPETAERCAGCGAPASCQNFRR